MPPLNQQLHQPLRILAYGPPKTKKTWWAGAAAEAGFNVILLDGDDGSYVLKNLTPEAQERVQIINLLPKITSGVMAPFMVRLLKQKEFIWDETLRSTTFLASSITAEHSYYKFNASLFGLNDVLVIDSWTSLAASLAQVYALENDIDLSNAAKTDWDGYGYCGRLADYILEVMHALACHVIVVGHQDIYEKRDNTNPDKARRNDVLYTRTQPKSTSGPQAMRMAKHFDVLYFTTTGQTFSISSGAGSDRDGGSRIVKPGNYKWKDLQFSDIAAMAGFDVGVSTELQGLEYFPVGHPPVIDTPQITKTLTPSAAAKPGELKTAGFAALMAKKS